ncbi:C40 family peptidase [Actinophytocola gossypii]|uniref:C40 family peptidase n=1 Tax=Actinophytocola gossypii TaxID=2812003 RepID=UPI0021A4BA4F|nr:C40 family peptidase [Actinophytocola gossypii]
MSPSPALALPPAPHQQPPPDTASEALEQYQKLTDRAEKVNEDLLAAKDDLRKKQDALKKANADLANAKKAQEQAEADEEAFRGRVDQLAAASFQGARFNKLSALLTGSSSEDFLERAAALGVLASDSEQALTKLTNAVDMAAGAKAKAADATSRAEQATVAARKLRDKIQKKADDLDARADEVKEAYDELSGADQETLAGGGDNSVFLGGPGLGGAAAKVAMDQRGDMYVYGAEGPDEFDCSGLTMFAYNAVGISLPHSSRAQYGYGVAVGYGEWQIGDLLFYGSSPGSIHHVAMYIGGGQLVHASQSGTPVQTASAPDGGGSDYLGARRIAG